MKVLYCLMLVLLASIGYTQGIKISELYTGGGSTNPTYNVDYVELYNTTSSAVTMTNWSIQYASATGTSYNVASYSATIQAYSFLLIRVSTVGATGAAVSSDITTATTLAFQANNGKVALVNNSTAITGPTGTNVEDFVGYGSANQFETQATQALSISTAAVRKANATSTATSMGPMGTDRNNGNGYDTGNNSTDFVVIAPDPQNSMSPPENSGGGGGTNPALTPTSTALSFGSVTVGSTSAEQSYMLTATNLQGDVTVSTTAPFSISKTMSTGFGTSLAFTTAELATSQTVYVRFSPSAAGSASANITHTSTNLIPSPIVSLSGSGFSQGSSSFDFSACTSSLSDGFTQYSTIGAQVWACTAFGRNPSNNTLDAPSAVQINGFSSGNVENEDWLISPPISISSDLNMYPYFNFWARTKFDGDPIEVKISTNYTSGDPALATWTTLLTTLPNNNSDVWTQTNNIDLSNYRGQSVKVAFVYYSSTTEAARWTIDDIVFASSSTPPPPSIIPDKSSINFGYTAPSSMSTQTISLQSINLQGNVTITTNAPYTVSMDGISYSTSIVITQATANNVLSNVYIKFSPTVVNQQYPAALSISSPMISTISIPLQGNTVSQSGTLDVVAWNIEWYSDNTANGPDNDLQQETNVLKIFREINADVYGLGEIVDTVALKRLVDSLGNTDFGYYVGKYASGVSSSSSSTYGSAQKLAFVYRKSMVNPVSFGPLFFTTNTAAPEYNYWASGRFPLMMEADVTIGTTTQRISFILIHAKAQNSATAYERRKNAATLLKTYLDTNKPTERFVVLGDFNDDLDVTIASSSETPAGDYPKSSYSVMISDSAKYKSITLPLSYAGLKSTVGYNDVIDHMVTSNELGLEYTPNSASILRSQVESWVSNYGSTTSDHYPVMARFAYLNVPLPLRLYNLKATAAGQNNRITWETTGEEKVISYELQKSTDGQNWSSIQVSTPKNQGRSEYVIIDEEVFLTDATYYKVKTNYNDGDFEYSNVVAVDRSATESMNIYPNPTSGSFLIKRKDQLPYDITILSADGKIVKQINAYSGDALIDLSIHSKGIYQIFINSASVINRFPLILTK